VEAAAQDRAVTYVPLGVRSCK